VCVAGGTVSVLGQLVGCYSIATCSTQMKNHCDKLVLREYVIVIDVMYICCSYACCCAVTGPMMSLLALRALALEGILNRAVKWTTTKLSVKPLTHAEAMDTRPFSPAHIH